MDPFTYFQSTDIVNKKQYDALRAFFLEGGQVSKIAERYRYTSHSFYSLIKELKEILKNTEEDPFFKEVRLGRKAHPDIILDDHIISLRKQNYSTEDIVSMVNSMDYRVSYGYVHILLKREGFGKLPRRSKVDKSSLSAPKLTAPSSEMISLTAEYGQPYQNQKYLDGAHGVHLRVIKVTLINPKNNKKCDVYIYYLA